MNYYRRGGEVQDPRTLQEKLLQGLMTFLRGEYFEDFRTGVGKFGRIGRLGRVGETGLET